jgi:hypothetical protein
MKPALVVVLILALASMACSFSVDVPSARETGPTQTFTVNEPKPAGEAATTVVLNMGAGELNLSGGAAGLVDGTIEYNIDEWKPLIEKRENYFRLYQENVESLSFKTDITNRWDLKLNSEVPLDLEINAGAYEGDLDLSGLRLQNLEIADGASKVDVRFTSPNPEILSRLTYRTGASEVKLEGLANSNFQEMEFESGAGNYTLDFGGTLKQDAEVTIRSGVSQVTVIIPAGMRVQVESDGALNNIDLDGDWTTQGDRYQTEGSGPLLTIQVDMGVGQLNLVKR